LQFVLNLQAKANDKGTPQLTADCTIRVTIVDENNKKPYVNPLLQTFDVFDSKCHN